MPTQTVTIKVTYDPTSNYKNDVPDVEIDGENYECEDFPSGPHVIWHICDLPGNQTLTLVQEEG